jgi:hypothetical protein
MINQDSVTPLLNYQQTISPFIVKENDSINKNYSGYISPYSNNSNMLSPFIKNNEFKNDLFYSEQKTLPSQNGFISPFIQNDSTGILPVRRQLQSPFTMNNNEIKNDRVNDYFSNYNNTACNNDMKTELDSKQNINDYEIIDEPLDLWTSVLSPTAMSDTMSATSMNNIFSKIDYNKDRRSLNNSQLMASSQNEKQKLSFTPFFSNTPSFTERKDMDNIISSPFTTTNSMNKKTMMNNCRNTMSMAFTGFSKSGINDLLMNKNNLNMSSMISNDDDLTLTVESPVCLPSNSSMTPNKTQTITSSNTLQNSINNIRPPSVPMSSSIKNYINQLRETIQELEFQNMELMKKLGNNDNIKNSFKC